MQKVPINPTMPWQAGDNFSHQGPSTEATGFGGPFPQITAVVFRAVQVVLQAVNRSSTT